MSTPRRRALHLDQAAITINGTPLHHWGLTATSEGIDPGSSTPAITWQDIPGADPIDTTLDDPYGYPAMSRRLILIHAAAIGNRYDIEETKQAVGALAGRRIRLGGVTPVGEYEGRLSIGSWTDHPTCGLTDMWSTCELSVDALACALGPVHTIPLDAAGVMTPLLVPGNRPTRPVLRQRVTLRDITPSAATFLMETRDGQRIRTTLTPSDSDMGSTHELIVDCDHHSATWDNIPVGVHLADDYPSLNPGRTSVRGDVTPRTMITRLDQTLLITPRWMT